MSLLQLQFTPSSPFRSEQRGQANAPNIAYQGPLFSGGDTGIFRQISHFATKVMENPSSQVIAEDLIGFGLLRTIFDLTRGFFYSDKDDQGFFKTLFQNIHDFIYPTPDNPRENLFNKSMARERIIREGGNLFATNFLGGLVFAALAMGTNQLGKGTVAQQHASLETLEVFSHLLKTAKTPEAFIDQAAHFIAGPQSDKAPKVVKLLTELQEELSPKARKTHLAQLQAIAAENSHAKNMAAIAKKLNSGKPTEKTLNQTGQKLKEMASDAAKAAKKAGKESKAQLSNGVQRIVETLRTPQSIITEKAKDITHTLDPKATTFDIRRMLPQLKEEHRFSVETLAGDIQQFVAKATDKAKHGTSWQNTAQGLVKRTQRFSKWATPLAYSAAFVFTVLVPIFNKVYTEKKDKTKSYPGVKGLKALEPVDTNKKTWFEEYMPYVTEQTRKGDLLPLLYGLLPIPLAVGITNNAAIQKGNWKEAVLNPFKKGFARKLLRLFQFRKGFPFVSVQQIFALCATVMSARLLTAREKTEARERLVDTYAGWGIWVAVLPNIQNIIANQMDKKLGTAMMKTLPNGSRVMRDQGEIAALLPKAVAEKTFNVLKPLKHRIFMLMILLMGVVEPLIAIKWTEAQIKKEEKETKELPNIATTSTDKSNANTPVENSVITAAAAPVDTPIQAAALPLRANPTWPTWQATWQNDPMIHSSTVQTPVWPFTPAPYVPTLDFSAPTELFKQSQPA